MTIDDRKPQQKPTTSRFYPMNQNAIIICTDKPDGPGEESVLGLSSGSGFIGSPCDRSRLVRIISPAMPVDKLKVQGPPLSPELRLNRACEIYLDMQKRHLKPRSLEAYKYHFRTLKSFFDPSRTLSSFHEGDLRDYQRWRSLPDTENGKAGPSLINHELGALAQLLKLAGLWIPINNYYKRLPEKNWTHPKVLTAEEEDRFFRLAASKPRWRTAYNSARLTANSTISGCELRTLRLENLRLNHVPPTVNVSEAAKNKHRMRAVPLNETAMAAIRDLLVLARERGSVYPSHYLIAYRMKNGVYVPGRPASPYFIRTAFRAIGRACGLRWVTPTTFRHQAITKLLESGAPDETVRSIAGHVSQRAMSYYSHIRIEAKKVALDRLEPLPKGLKSANSRRGTFPLLKQLRTMANQLGIKADAALELVLAYERSKALAE
jgi:integrase